MGLLESFVTEHLGTLLMISAVAAVYLTNLVALDALVWRRQGESPGRRAVAHWLPIASIALVALLMGRADIAIGVTFATSVASLSLVLGVVALYRGMAPQTDRPRNVWAFVLPAAVLALLCGFRGHFEPLHGAVLFVQGLAVWLAWRSGAVVPAIDAHTTENQGAGAGFTFLRVIQLILGVGIALVGGWAATRGVVERSVLVHSYTPSVIAATLLGPLLVFPMLVTGSALARQGRADEAISTQSGIVFLNLCLLLPMLIGVAYVRDIVAHPQHAPLTWLGNVIENAKSAGDTKSTTKTGVAPATSPVTTSPSTQTSPASSTTTVPSSETVEQVLPYPLVVWRVDTVLLVVLGFMLIPVSLGRLTLGQAEAAVLIAGYCGYYLVSIYLGMRWG